MTPHRLLDAQFEFGPFRPGWLREARAATPRTDERTHVRFPARKPSETIPMPTHPPAVDRGSRVGIKA